MRLRLVPSETRWDFFRLARYTTIASITAMALSLIALPIFGLNFGIDFRGGTTIRTVSTMPVDVGAYREAVSVLGLGDVAVTEVFDISFGAGEHVAQVRFEAQEGDEAVAAETVRLVESALKQLDPDMQFPLVESVGPKCRGS